MKPVELSGKGGISEREINELETNSMTKKSETYIEA
jgi:hypothetical protein